MHGRPAMQSRTPLPRRICEPARIAAAARRPRLVANMASARTLLRPLLSAGLAARESATVALAAVAEPAGCTSFCRASRQSARYSTSYGKLPCAAPSAALAAALTKPGLLLRGGVPPAPGLHRERPPRNPHQPSGVPGQPLSFAPRPAWVLPSGVARFRPRIQSTRFQIQCCALHTGRVFLAGDDFPADGPTKLGGQAPAPNLRTSGPPSAERPHSADLTADDAVHAGDKAAEAHAHAAHFAVTKGSFARLRLRLKIMLMKQIRPWTVDDFMAMFSWVFVANGLYIVLGTTSFVSIVLWVVNSLQFQEFVARRLGDYLTRETGVTVTFESAIVPNWKDGKISLRNVCFSRQRSLPAEGEAASQGLPKDDYMYYDLTVEQIDVTLDLMRWLDGKGILRDARIKGVRGTLDRSHLVYDPNAPTWPKRKAQPGDLQLESFTLEDLLVTILQVGNFRPYTISIFNADAPHGLRIQWLLYDLLCAESMVGMFDQCLFSLHTPQKTSMTAEEEKRLMGSGRRSRLRIDGVPIDHLNAGVSGPFGWITSGKLGISADVFIPEAPHDDLVSQIVYDIVDKIDDITLASTPGPANKGSIAEVDANSGDGKDDRLGVPIHNPTAFAADGPYSSGDATRKRPSEDVDGAVTSEMRFEDDDPPVIISKRRKMGIRRGWEEVKEGLRRRKPRDYSKPALVMNLDIRLNNLKASIPIGNPDLSYLSSALVRPVVAYMNANRTSLPINISIALDLENFNGSWTIYQCGLVDAISDEIGRAVVLMASSERERHRRLKRVGLWGLQLGTRNLVALWEHVRGHSEFWVSLGAGLAEAGEKHRQRMAAGPQFGEEAAAAIAWGPEGGRHHYSHR